MQQAPRHRRRPRLRLVAAVCVALGLVAAAPAAADTSGGADNLVLVQTTVDGASAARAHGEVVQTVGPTVSSTNLADATASDCSDCHAAAVAVQVVLVSGSPSTVTPANVAAATTAGCSTCSAFAYAWQDVVPVDGPVHLTAQGQQQVTALEQEIDAAASVAPVTFDDATALRARLDVLTSELAAVVQQNVQTSGVGAAGPSQIQSQSDYRPG